MQHIQQSTLARAGTQIETQQREDLSEQPLKVEQKEGSSKGLEEEVANLALLAFLPLWACSLLMETSDKDGSAQHVQTNDSAGFRPLRQTSISVEKRFLQGSILVVPRANDGVLFDISTP